MLAKKRPKTGNAVTLRAPATSTALTPLGFDYGEVVPAAAEQLREHAARIRELGLKAAAELRQVAGRAAVAMGKELSLAKKKVRDDDRLWTEWVERECGLKIGTAENMMRLANHPNVDDARFANTFAILPASALYEVCRTSTPPVVWDSIESRLDAGDIPTIRELKAIIADAKGPVKPARVISNDNDNTAEESSDADDYATSNSAEAIWHRGFMYRAEDSAGNAPFNEPPPGFIVTNEHLMAARAAAAAWTKTAELIAAKLEPSDNAAESTPTPLDDVTVIDGKRYIKWYEHVFEHGTCHELPDDKDYLSPAWQKWRADHPTQWKWRQAEVDANGDRVRDKKGRPLPWGPWFLPDGSRAPKGIDLSSPKGKKFLATPEGQKVQAAITALMTGKPTESKPNNDKLAKSAAWLAKLNARLDKARADVARAVKHQEKIKELGAQRNGPSESRVLDITIEAQYRQKSAQERADKLQAQIAKLKAKGK